MHSYADTLVRVYCEVELPVLFFELNVPKNDFANYQLSYRINYQSYS